MKASIRTFLLINLLFSVALITSLAIIANLVLEHKDLDTHLDDKLTETAFTLEALASHPNFVADAPTIQKKINAIPHMQENFLTREGKRLFNQPYEQVQFQIWSKDGTLLLHSYNLFHKPFYKQTEGFADVWVNDEPWRLFTLRNPDTGITVVVFEGYDFRGLLQGRITQDSIFIMLVTYPLLGLLIWIIVGRGLSSLSKVTEEVSNRVPGYLEAVDLNHVPIEIVPLVNELNRLFTRLQEALNREKRFAADAAHELRTPLAALKTQTQVALQAATEQERHAALKKILAGVDRSTHVVQQLLTLSRMVPEAVMEQVEPVDLTKQATDVIADLAPEGLKKQTELELIAPEMPCILTGNAIAINILIRNLVVNAIRYTQPGSWVKVLVEESPEYLILKVIDNGPGIPEKLRKRVFERFFRVLGNTAPGSGLGLGIVQRIAELHQAIIHLDTPASGQGLEVTILFPRQSA